jgi:hypothetical protein
MKKLGLLILVISALAANAGKIKQNVSDNMKHKVNALSISTHNNISTKHIVAVMKDGDEKIVKRYCIKHGLKLVAITPEKVKSNTSYKVCAIKDVELSQTNLYIKSSEYDDYFPTVCAAFIALVIGFLGIHLFHKYERKREINNL